MKALRLVLEGAFLIASSGVLALLLAQRPRAATLTAAAGGVLGGIVGLWGASLAVIGDTVAELGAAWRVPGGGLVVGVDPLSGFFLAPLFALGALCVIYGRSYLGDNAAAAAGLNLLLGAMSLVLLARHALLFLVAWEVMTLLAYLLVTLEHGDAEVRRAGWVYLIASHIALLALVSLFLFLGSRLGGALQFGVFASQREASASLGGTLLLSLALLGFGVKAGVFGLHVWLPEAHAAAPSHVSALMSGVLIKLGLYGLLRTAHFVAPGSWFGVTLMVLGVAGALLGIALALYQRDLKRVLAYSSIENVGVILLGLGLGYWARSRGETQLAALAFAGAFLHVWNHAAMKGLLFLAAGSVVHATGTKDVERLGGLLRRMPWTGRAVTVGAVAIAALPPCNGFASEWLIYLALAQVGLRGSGASSLAAIGGAGALALSGGLAALCFVRLLGVVFLGVPRSGEAANAQESPFAMTIPLLLLAVACAAGAIVAPALVSAQSGLLRRIGGATRADVAAAAHSLAPVVSASSALMVVSGFAVILVTRATAHRQVSETWGCGYVAPSGRMQYSGRAISELLTTRVFPRWIRVQAIAQPPMGLFPTTASFVSRAHDPLTRGLYEPFLVKWGDRFARLRFLQQGNVHIYIIYIVVTAITGLAWVAAREWLVQ